MKTFFAALLGVTSLALPAAFAQDRPEEEIPGLQTDGGISFAIAGTEYRYHTVSYLFDTVRVGSASVQEGSGSFGNILGISALGNPDGSGNSFHLSIGYREHPDAGETGGLFDPPVLVWYPDGDEQPFWASLTSPGDLPEITFTRFEFDGQSGYASGTFQGRICLVAGIDSEEPDPANCQPVSGSFESALHKAF
ncbi:hypothetical protein [Pseudogemmobacter bohemicus]|uniref:hypothetical protein n=1 Tax=Pseudogemmobacter bohemicus TaxID=2250708 RepID=UPI0013007503|nr:hypothetical protein [Pseudogemmobacter bohemicus]